MGQTKNAVSQQANIHTIYLSLGSNMGERKSNLIIALQKLRLFTELQRISSIYETDPVGYQNQDQFLNLVCRAITHLTAQELLYRAKKIEGEMGRQATFRNAPRPIDIDILLYDEQIIQQDDLIVPHPRMTERAFVLVPLYEIAPQIVEPVSQQTIQKLYENISTEGVIKREGKIQI